MKNDTSATSGIDPTPARSVCAKKIESRNGNRPRKHVIAHLAAGVDQEPGHAAHMPKHAASDGKRIDHLRSRLARSVAVQIGLATA